MLGEPPDDETATSTSPGAGLGLQLVDEDVLVAGVVRYRGEQLHVRAEAQHLRAEVGGRPDALNVVALHVVRDRRRAAVTAGEHPGTAQVGLDQDRGRAVECGGVDGLRGPGHLLRIASKYDAALVYGAIGNLTGLLSADGAKA